MPACTYMLTLNVLYQYIFFFVEKTKRSKLRRSPDTKPASKLKSVPKQTYRDCRPFLQGAVILICRKVDCVNFTASQQESRKSGAAGRSTTRRPTSNVEYHPTKTHIYTRAKRTKLGNPRPFGIGFLELFMHCSFELI